MERLAKVACYFRWIRKAPVTTPPATLPDKENNNSNAKNEDEELFHGEESNRDAIHDVEAMTRLCAILESILLWENSVNSISVVIVFNILFWGIVILEVRGFAAASSAALVVVLCYTSLEAQAQRERKDKLESHAKAEHIERIGRKIKSTLQSLKQLRREQPGVFCIAVCSVSLGVWIIGRTVNGVLLAYTICMSILLVPALLLKLPGKMISHKEWDSEVDEFLPVVTEDSLNLLRRAGESGDHSPTPSSVQSDIQNDIFNEENLVGLRMPSHEDESIDDVELSELELSGEDNEIDGIKFQSGHFEKGSSSEEEAELQPKLQPSISNDSDSDFEVIDSREIANINNNT